MIPDLIGQGTRAGHIQRVIRSVQDEESTYNLTGGDKERLPFMPFQWADFIAMLAECVAETNGPHFLDVGCGPGTKMALAHEIFALKPAGIEIDRRLGQIAQHRAPTLVGDALEFAHYGDYDIIWLYKPFRDHEKEAQLERRIHEQMKPGAILAGGAWWLHPPRDWLTIIDDWEIRRGAWQKPECRS